MLVTSCRIHFIKEHLSVIATGFSYARKQQFLAENWQLMNSEKNMKKLHNT